jgi:putative phosphoesterase
MKIGIISDTHGILPESIFDIFKGVDQIFHAGDIGSQDVIQGLEIIAPVSAVYGNVDTWPLVVNYRDMIVTELEGRRICLIHDIVKPKYFSFQLFKKNIGVDIVISGHTHVISYEMFRGISYINPGSAVKPRGRKFGTVAILDLADINLRPEIIEIQNGS